MKWSIPLIFIMLLTQSCASTHTNTVTSNPFYHEGPSWQSGEITLEGDTITAIGCSQAVGFSHFSSFTWDIAENEARYAIARYFKSEISITSTTEKSANSKKHTISSISISESTICYAKIIQYAAFADGQYCVKVSGKIQNIK